MPAKKFEEKYRCLKCSGYLNGSISSRRVSSGGRVIYYECISCNVKFKSAEGGPLETVKKAVDISLKDVFDCPHCETSLTGCVSVKRLKDGRRSRYFNCEVCDRKYRHTEGEGLFESKQGSNNHTSPMKTLSGMVPGARVFIDGKFVGVAK